MTLKIDVNTGRPLKNRISNAAIAVPAYKSLNLCLKTYWKKPFTMYSIARKENTISRKGNRDVGNWERANNNMKKPIKIK